MSEKKRPWWLANIPFGMVLLWSVPMVLLGIIIDIMRINALYDVDKLATDFEVCRAYQPEGKRCKLEFIVVLVDHD
jgi:hypothetical protein